MTPPGCGAPFTRKGKKSQESNLCERKMRKNARWSGSQVGVHVKGGKTVGRAARFGHSSWQMISWVLGRMDNSRAPARGIAPVFSWGSLLCWTRKLELLVLPWAMPGFQVEENHVASKYSHFPWTRRRIGGIAGRLFSLVSSARIGAVSHGKLSCRCCDGVWV